MDNHYCSPGECSYDWGKIINDNTKLPTYPVDVKTQVCLFAVLFVLVFVS